MLLYLVKYKKEGKMFGIKKKSKSPKALKAPEVSEVPELTEDEEYELAAKTANGVGGFGNPSMNELDEILHPKEIKKKSKKK